MFKYDAQRENEINSQSKLYNQNLILHTEDRVKLNKALTTKELDVLSC